MKFHSITHDLHKKIDYISMKTTLNLIYDVLGSHNQTKMHY